jgi:hypothetical protein
MTVDGVENFWKEAIVKNSGGIPRKISVRINSILAEIRTKHLPNASLEYYDYVNYLDVWCALHC